jgi:hypothetical protein
MIAARPVGSLYIGVAAPVDDEDAAADAAEEAAEAAEDAFAETEAAPEETAAEALAAAEEAAEEALWRSQSAKQAIRNIFVWTNFQTHPEGAGVALPLAALPVIEASWESSSKTPPVMLAGALAAATFAAALWYASMVSPLDLFVIPLATTWQLKSSLSAVCKKRHIRKVDTTDHTILAMCRNGTVVIDRIGGGNIYNESLLSIVGSVERAWEEAIRLAWVVKSTLSDVVLGIELEDDSVTLSCSKGLWIKDKTVLAYINLVHSSEGDCGESKNAEAESHDEEE